MRSAVVRAAMAVLAGLAAVQLGGCPQFTGGDTDVIEGSPGETSQVRSEASVTVLTPASSLSITGGTQVEVNWQAFATTRFALVDVFFDVDENPDNNNEIGGFLNLPLSSNNALLDTTSLEQGRYFVGVRVKEVGVIVAFDYAPGQISIDQRSLLTFSSPRGNFVYDRTDFVTPRFDVTWAVEDPDSQITVEILLDPDDLPDGDEILLYRSESQTGDSFTFNLPTASFESGEYRILANVSDGQRSIPFYAPGVIRLRARVAGYVDLRDIDVSSERVTGVVWEGFNPRDNAGSFVSSAGDIDADGFDDIMLVAQFGKPAYETNFQRTGIGEAYLIYGRQRRFTGVNNLNSTGTLYRGEIYGGVFEVPDPIRPTRGITSFAVLSDWDGDGVREFAWGVPFTDSEPGGSGGAAWLESFGSFRTGGVIITAGLTLRPDVNFPGRQVFLLSEFGTHPFQGITEAPCVETFYGPHSPEGPTGVTYFHRHVFAADIAPELVRSGARIWTNDFGDQCGETVSAYDFDGILISVPNRDPGVCTTANSTPGAGVVSLYFGGVSLWDGESNTLPHGGPFHYVLDDIRLYTAAVEGGTGLFVGSPGYYVDPDDSENPCDRVFDGRTPIRGNTTRFYGEQVGARLGGAVGIDDFNADGLQDILLGSPLSNQGAGACFIVLGRLPRLVVGDELSVEELGLPMDASDPLARRVFDGIRVIGAPGDRLGQSQADAGDFNNDGISDVVIGSPLINSRRGGAAVFFGAREVINLTQEEIPFNELDTRGLGVIFEGVDEGDLAGARVANAGDVDGDGNSDILIAAPERDVKLDIDLDGVLEIDRTDCGVVYLIYGSPDLRGRYSLADIGTERLPGAVLIGRQSGDQLGAAVGEQGDRSTGIALAGDVDGDGFDDLLISSAKASPRDRQAAGEVYLIYGSGD